jgi:hypothetical protein
MGTRISTHRFVETQKFRSSRVPVATQEAEVRRFTV